MTAVAVAGVAAVRDRIMDAAQRRSPLRITGRGTWLDAGRPVQASESLSTRELAGITGYVPGDLTLTALAGTTLGEIRSATGANGQWLALDPHGTDGGSIGATVATASAGPLLTSFGKPRDLVLGVEFVTGAGVIARGGGRVVKNVAGFDITRLMTGAWGTLGVLTEITVRLHARPEADESFAIALDSADGPARVRQLLRRLPFVPYACEVVNEALAIQLLATNQMLALVRTGGNGESVRAQRAAFAELGNARQVDPDIWQRFRSAEPENAIVIRFSQLPSEIGRTWSEAHTVASVCPGTKLHATPSRGVVRAIVPNADGSASARLTELFRNRTSVTRIAERLPMDLWPCCPIPGGGGELSMRLKRTFDPNRILNSGILGDIA